MPPFPKIEDTPNFAPPTESALPVLVWVLLGLMVAGAIYGVVLWRHRVQSRLGALPPATPLASHVLAMNLLEDLRPRAAEIQPKEMAARVVEIVRTFLHRQFGIMARYRTSQEILALRQKSEGPPPAPAVREFEDFLLHSESLNYGAKDHSHADALIDEAINVIRRSMDHVNHTARTTPPPP